MVETIQAVRGMHDILPEQITRWQRIEAAFREIFASYGYSEIRLPVVEKTELFKRSIGEVTDIVEKEMYTFEDRNGDSLSLRPEGTAGCLRACLEHGLLHNQTQRLWYQGPMFRHERPQKGRYRQFFQVGAEAYGIATPDIDAELILLTQRLWKQLKVDGKVELHLNSLGSMEERAEYRNHLVDYLQGHRDKLDEDSIRRLDSNPLRILDSKNPCMETVIAEAPVLLDYLGESSKAHFEELTATLEHLGVSFVVNPHLVRGLDYYCQTVFEWVTDQLGAQGTICAGGRYDSLIVQLGGRNSHAIGFALGMERLVSLLDDCDEDSATCGAYFVLAGDAARREGPRLAERLRDQLANPKIVVHCGGGGLKSQFKKADKSGARIALILGDEELSQESIGVKPLRSDAPQNNIALTELQEFLQKTL